jgi:hypothetical protein
VIDVVDQRQRRKSSSRSSREPRVRAPNDEPEISVADVVEAAQRHIVALTNKRAGGVTSVDPTDDGWRVEVEVVEEERIPASLDVLGLYELELDAAGELVAYRRRSRYSRTSGLKDST